MNRLTTLHGDVNLPLFIPDATRAVVKTIDSTDLNECGIEGIMVNGLHLSLHPGISTLRSTGSVHRFMGWEGLIACDSGGFQVFSLLNQSSDSGSVSTKGFTYRYPGSRKKRILTPEKAIQTQLRIRADILFCLDYCTHPGASADQHRSSVNNTIEWARRSRKEFNSQLDRNEIENPPLLFAVVQGGSDPSLRAQCAEALLEIGFDGFGFGGWPIDETGQLIDMVEYTAELIPDSYPLHGLGIGKPENMVGAFRKGYHIFDCVIPTRDARHKRLYVFNDTDVSISKTAEDFYSCLYMQDDRYIRDARPLDEGCNCICCRKYSRAYLHHLFKVRDPLAQRLATIHNLRFYTRLIERLRNDG